MKRNTLSFFDRMNANLESQNRVLDRTGRAQRGECGSDFREGWDRTKSPSRFWVFSHFLLLAAERDDGDILVLLSERERRRVKSSSDEEERKSAERAWSERDEEIYLGAIVLSFPLVAFKGLTRDVGWEVGLDDLDLYLL